MRIVQELDENLFKALAWKQNLKLDHMIEVIGCGSHANGALFAVRFASKDSVQDGGDSYMLTQWR